MDGNNEVARQIEALNNEAMDSFRRKDVDKLVAGFAEDAKFLGAHQPIAVGRAQIAAAWKALMDLPNVTARWGSSEVRVAGSGELAYELGTYSLSFDGLAKRIEDLGKYVVVWRKDGASWKIVADIINSDVPIAP
jgi:ketosteroid isomerase-like protein